MYVIAIDYGTGRSGVAYALKKDDIQWRGGIVYIEKWPMKQAGAKNCDTSLLVDRDGRVLSWGRAAFRKSTASDCDGYYANLVKRDLYDSIGVKDEAFRLDCSDKERGPRRVYRDGASFYSVDLIASYLAILKRETVKHIWRSAPETFKAHLLCLEDRPTAIFDETDYCKDKGLARAFIHEQIWVLTVPANADGTQMRYMRQAAYKAGLIEDLNSSNLRFAFEPETAAVYCGAAQDGVSVLRDGDAFVVVDSGCGTVDVSAYRFRNGAYEQLAKSQAANAGSSYLDEALADVVDGLFAPEQKGDFADFKRENEKEWHEIQYGAFSIEKEKEIATLEDPLTVELCKMTDWLQKSKRGLCLKSRFLIGSELTLEPDDLRECFEPVFERAWEPAQCVLDNLKRQGVQPARVLLVGGMGASPYFEEFAKKKLGGTFVLTSLKAHDKRVAVLGGAVLQGVKERVVKRVLRRSYGTVCCVPYDTEEAKRKFESVPPSSVAWYPDAPRNPWVKDAVSFFVRNGEAVETNQTIAKIYKVKSPTQSKVCFELVASEETRQLLKSDKSVECWARVELLLSGVGMDRGAKVELRFGETEVFLAATEIGRESNRVECRGRLGEDRCAPPTASRTEQADDGERLRFDFE